MNFTTYGSIVGGRYLVERRLNAGSFGEVLTGRDMQAGEPVAIKMESLETRSPQLRYEAKLYRTFAGSFGVPNLRWFGMDGGYNVLVCDLLGPSLQELFDICGSKFSLKTVLSLAEQMISRLEWLHSRNFLHRDVKPENFVMGVGENSNIVHIIDFGLSKKFRDNQLEHIPYREGKRMIGTLRYASLPAHLGFEQGRRDDLESLGYVLMYFLRGNLPWQGIASGAMDNHSEKLLISKMSTPVETLCDGFPNEFVSYFHACKNMRFNDKPDYPYLKSLFRDAFSREGYHQDYMFDWAEVDMDAVAKQDKPAISGRQQSKAASEVQQCKQGSSQSSLSAAEEVSTASPSSP
jgi:serine/threonine protein kinase